MLDMRSFTIALLGSMLLVPATLHAQEGQTVHYAGRIDLDGQPITDTLDLRVSLYDSTDDQATALWSEEHTDVPVVAGRFSIRLGSVTALTPDKQRGGDRYVGIEIGDGTGSYPIALEGRKLLSSTPYAWGGAPGQDFMVDGALVSSKPGTGIDAGALMLTNETTGKRWFIPMRAGDADKLQFYRHNGTDWAHVMTLDMNGRVGIGTSAPAERLHVNGNTRVDGTLSVSGSLSAGAMSVSSLSSSGALRGSTVNGRVIGSYTSTRGSGARACMYTCQDLGGRMATYDELVGAAAAGANWCSYNWYIRPSQTEMPCLGYPMYMNYTTAGQCGRTNTGQMPRIEGHSCGYNWDNGTSRKCACSLIK